MIASTLVFIYPGSAFIRRMWLAAIARRAKAP